MTSSSRAVGPDATLSLIESRFRGAIAASLDAFFLCESVRDAAGTIVDFRLVELNERGEDLLGRPRADSGCKLLRPRVDGAADLAEMAVERLVEQRGAAGEDFV